MKPRVVPELFSGPKISSDPLDRRILDDVTQFKHAWVRLRLGLLGVASIDEQRSLVFENNREPGRAGEARQPKQALCAGGHIFVLMLVRARNDKSVDPRLLKGATQRRNPLGSLLRPARLGKRLKVTFKHGLSSWRRALKRRPAR